jgi:hypothetical protein
MVDETFGERQGAGGAVSYILDGVGVGFGLVPAHRHRADRPAGLALRRPGRPPGPRRPQARPPLRPPSPPPHQTRRPVARRRRPILPIRVCLTTSIVSENGRTKGARSKSRTKSPKIQITRAITFLIRVAICPSRATCMCPRGRGRFR